MRKTESRNCPAGTAGTLLKARITLSEAAQHLNNMIVRFPLKPTFAELDKHLATWASVMIGNVKMMWPSMLCRRHVAWIADDKLVEVPDSEGPEVQYVDMLHPNCPLDEDVTLTYDHVNGIFMFRCAPTEDDELQMNSTLSKMLEIAGDESAEISVEFEKAVAFAQDHHYWPELLKNAFAGPEFIRLVEANKDKIGRICKLWVEKSETTTRSRVESTNIAVREIDELCIAVVGFLNTVPNDDVTHEAMGNVFGVNAELSPWLGSLVTTFRQSDGWDAIERDGLDHRGFEKKHRQDFFTYKRQALDDTNIKDLMEKLPLYMSPKGFRAGQVECLEENAYMFIEGRIRELVEMDDFAMQADIRRRKLTALSGCLDLWKSNPHLADEVAALQLECDGAARGIEAAAAASQISEQVDDNNVFNKVLGQRLQKLVGHNDASHKAAFVKLNSLFLSKCLDYIGELGEQKFEILLQNWATLHGLWSDKKASHFFTVNPIIVKSRAFLLKYKSWIADPKKEVNVNAVNAAARAWDNAMVKAGEEADKSPGSPLHKILEAVHQDETIIEASAKFKQLLVTKRKSAKDIFVTAIDGHEKLCGGLRESGSWKQGLTPASSQSQVFEASKILTSGPGAQVLKMKDDICEAPGPSPYESTDAGRPDDSLESPLQAIRGSTLCDF